MYIPCARAHHAHIILFKQHSCVHTGRTLYALTWKNYNFIAFEREREGTEQKKRKKRENKQTNKSDENGTFVTIVWNSLYSLWLTKHGNEQIAILPVAAVESWSPFLIQFICLLCISGFDCAIVDTWTMSPHQNTLNLSFSHDFCYRRLVHNKWIGQIDIHWILYTYSICFTLDTAITHLVWMWIQLGTR